MIKPKNDQPKKKDQMSKEDAKKMLEALEQKEKELQEKLQKKKVKGQRVKVLKDWYHEKNNFIINNL